MDDLLLPLFPLETVLLPEEPLPLHIFEDRYKQMIGECLKAKAASAPAQDFGVVLAQGREIASVGCTAGIVNVTRRYEDGRMDIFTVGRRRFEILYTNEDRPYVRAAVEYFDDDPDTELPDEAEAGVALDLFRQAMQRLHKSSEIPIHLPRPYRHLSFRIAGPLPLDLEFKQQLLTLRNEGERLREVTRVLDRLLSRLDLVSESRRKAGGNGNPKYSL
jgi:Lon protease-like protein